MAATSRLQAWQHELATQFRGLDPRDPGQWPSAPRLAAWAVALVLTLLLGWVLLLAQALEALDAARARELALKDTYRAKLAQAVQIHPLRQQKQAVQERVDRLEQQLPDQAEMDALLSGINQAGLARALSFELFKPGPVQLRDYHADMPITIRVTGRYHDLGGFAADLARLPRIVSIQDIQLTLQPEPPPRSDGRARAPAQLLAMEATARTYRTLSASELAEQQRARVAAEAKTTGARK
jgi:type IV pilus assembly protein PilO